MLLTNNEIAQAVDSGDISIQNAAEDGFNSISYRARLGCKALVEGEEDEKDLEKGPLVINPGKFFLLMTYEKFKLKDKMSGHLLVNKNLFHKGVIFLSGMQIDPCWSGHLVLGGYNASPKELVLDYKQDLVSIEFYQLTEVRKRLATRSPEQERGEMPTKAMEFLRTLVTENLSNLSNDIRVISQNVAAISERVYQMGKKLERMNKKVERMLIGLGVGIAALTLIITIVGIIAALN